MDLEAKVPGFENPASIVRVAPLWLLIYQKEYETYQYYKSHSHQSSNYLNHGSPPFAFKRRIERFFVILWNRYANARPYKSVEDIDSKNSQCVALAKQFPFQLDEFEDNWMHY